MNVTLTLESLRDLLFNVTRSLSNQVSDSQRERNSHQKHKYGAPDEISGAFQSGAVCPPKIDALIHLGVKSKRPHTVWVD